MKTIMKDLVFTTGKGCIKSLWRIVEWLAKRIILVAIVISVVMTGINHFLPNLKDMFVQTERTISIKEIKMCLSPIGEMATYEADYNLLYTDTNFRTLFGISWPFTDKYIEADYDGRIKVGFKMENVGIAVDDENHRIIVTLPQMECISHEIVEIHVHDATRNNIFNPIAPDDVTTAIEQTMEEAYIKAVKDEAIYEKATTNAETIISDLLSCFEGYEVVFLHE